MTSNSNLNNNLNSGSISKLFADASTFDAEEVASVIHPLVNVDKLEQGGVNIHLKPNRGLTVEEKILVFGLTLKILKNQGIKESESFAPQDLGDVGLKGNTVRPCLKSLKEQGMVIGANKNYKVPSDEVENILRKIKNKLNHE